MKHLRILFRLKSILKLNKATIVQSLILSILFVFAFTMFFFFTCNIDTSINRSGFNDNRTLQIKVIEPQINDKTKVIDDIRSMPLVEDAYFEEDTRHGESIKIVMDNYHDRYLVLNNLPSYFEKVNFYTHRIEGDLPKIQLVKWTGGLLTLIMLILVILIKGYFIKRLVHNNILALNLVRVLGFNQFHMMFFYLRQIVIEGFFTFSLVSTLQIITYQLVANKILSEIDFFTTYEIALTYDVKLTFVSLFVSILVSFLIILSNIHLYFYRARLVPVIEFD